MKRKKNRFEKFLKLTGIADGHRHDVDERASYFVWYHVNATGQADADLEIVSEYLRESETTPPDLHELYEKLSGPKQLVKRSPIPGRLQMRSSELLSEYLEPVIHAKGLAPLYFSRGADGRIIRIGSRKEQLKYWAQRHWLAPWIAIAIAVISLILSVYGVTVLS